MLRLWPSSSSTPERLKRSMATEAKEGRLSAHVENKDPYFVWRFDESLAARLVSLDVEAEEPGTIQLYWSSAACPTFRETCSLTDVVSPGRQWIDFLMDSTLPIRELRVDLPDKIGTTLWFYAIGVFDRAELGPRWVASAQGVTVNESVSGLELVALVRDPWMSVTTPGFQASRFDTVELVLHGVGAADVQLFWDGPCGHFDERCSVHFQPADAGALTHRADLSKVDTWRGPIGTLRLDPSQDEGDYAVERIAFSRSTAVVTKSR